jgi:Nif-specific regulatory protein
VSSELDSLRRERDFYRALVGFAGQEDLQLLLREAVDVLVARSGAREAVIEVMQDDGVDVTPCTAAHGCDGARLAAISTYISRGIISEAVATGESVVTANATEDPRFHDFASVRRAKVEAVLCVPIGRDPPIGVIYLQGKQGCDDFQPYDRHLQRDIEVVARALAPVVERLTAKAGMLASPPALAVVAGDPFSAVRGRGSALTEVLARLRLAAPLDIHILLTGASGVGKTLIANAVHIASRRQAARFVEINCAAIPDNLLENELFGAEVGAHSSVPRGGIKGKVEAAEGGTLFLDEVAEMSLGAQAKLLQLLQSKTYYRLGGAESRRADIRIIAATNVNLKVAVAERKFREDLYYRLQVLETRIPSLAERPEDVVPLAAGFLRQAIERHQLSHKTLSPGAIRAIQAAEWPGNVRELANRIEAAAIQAHLRAGDLLEARDIFADAPVEGDTDTMQGATRRFQRKHLLAVLTSTDWNVLEAARVLDVSRSQVYNLIRGLELKRE